MNYQNYFVLNKVNIFLLTFKDKNPGGNFY